MRVPLQVVKELAWGPKATKRPKTTSGNKPRNAGVSIILHKNTPKKGSGVSTELGAKSLNSAIQ